MEALPRLTVTALTTAQQAMPVVVITGARQAGKSTLAQAADPDRVYLTLDDIDVLDQAIRDPGGLVRRAPRHAR